MKRNLISAGLGGFGLLTVGFLLGAPVTAAANNSFAGIPRLPWPWGALAEGDTSLNAAGLYEFLAAG
jgi:hypothetical protein